MNVRVDLELAARDATKAVRRKDLIVAIDVLRCTSSIITHLRTARKKSSSREPWGEAYRLHREHPRFLLAGEAKGVRPRGFDLDNSPLEFVKQRVCGKTLILTTTSGTAALIRSGRADWVLIGAFLNAGSVARKAMEIAQRQEIGVSLVLSGRKGHFSMEDFLCGGAIAEDLRRHEADLSDLSCGAMLAFKQAKDSVCETIMAGEHARNLVDLRFEEDIRFCCQLDLYSIVPICKNGFIKLSKRKATEPRAEEIKTRPSITYKGGVQFLVCAYVLISTDLGKALEVVDKVAEVEGVKRACAVTGAFDIIATVDVEKLTDVADLVVKKIHHIDGVCGTQTLVCVTC